MNQDYEEYGDVEEQTRILHRKKKHRNRMILSGSTITILGLIFAFFTARTEIINTWEWLNNEFNASSDIKELKQESFTYKEEFESVSNTLFQIEQHQSLQEKHLNRIDNNVDTIRTEIVHIDDKLNIAPLGLGKETTMLTASNTLIVLQNE